MTESTMTCLVVGATGDLGMRVVRALQTAPNSPRIRAIVRGGVAGKYAQRARAWADAGVQIVDADINNADSLKQACDGTTTVLSILQGGPDVIVDGQARLLEAARTAGVTRFVPSDFSENTFGIPAGINPYLDWRRTFDLTVPPSGIGYMHLFKRRLYGGGLLEVGID